MSAKRKKEAPAPAREEAGQEPGVQDQYADAANGKKSPAPPAQPEPATTALPSVGRESPVLEEKWADPWAAAKAAGFLVDRVVQKCQSTGAKRCANGIWKVTPEVLVALGAPADRALAAVETAMEHRRALDDGRTEGAVVYALSGPGRVAVRSLAEKPRSSRILAQVREPSRLRCGDEVAIRYSESGRAEVVYGR
jgi:hypothetical protein